jgi:murein L,D-transpeptidase YafK
VGRILLRIAAILAVAATLAGCAPKSKFLTYDGPEVTRIVVMKADRRMYLMHHDQILEAYQIELGFTPEGHKQFEGDGRTPEGRYFIDRRNPNSTWHLSLGLSYPNPADRAHAASMGKSPGGDIFIHGEPRRGLDRGGPDWTAGCIAVTNEEMEVIYSMVRIGTPIDVFP